MSIETLGFRTLVLAAGGSRRFLDAGWRKPKPDLVIESDGECRRMLDWVLDQHSYQIGREIVVAGHPDMEGPDAPHRHFVVRKTRGQAHTLAQLIRRSCPLDTRILVVNSDMIIRTDHLVATCQAVHEGADFSVLVTPSDSQTMSYVNRTPHPTQFREKDRIGTHAMVGAWAFASSDMLTPALDVVIRELYEPYLSHALNYLPGVCRAVEVRPDMFVDWGTPEAIERSGARIIG